MKRFRGPPFLGPARVPARILLLALNHYTSGKPGSTILSRLESVPVKRYTDRADRSFYAALVKYCTIKRLPKGFEDYEMMPFRTAYRMSSGTL